MKFDPARVMDTVDELGDPRFATEGGEGRIADLVAARLTAMGWQVESREVSGSKLPWLAASWLGWVFAAIVATAATRLIGTRWPLPVWCCPALVVWVSWYIIGLAGGLRVGWNLPPRGSAPLVMAYRSGDSRPACRVVLQTPLGPLSAVPPGGSPVKAAIVACVLAFLILGATALARSGVAKRQSAASAVHDLTAPAVLLLGLFWVFVAIQAMREIRLSRQVAPLELADRTGIAVLLEMARTSSIPRDHGINLVLAAAGGQTLDFAGAARYLRRSGDCEARFRRCSYYCSHPAREK